MPLCSIFYLYNCRDLDLATFHKNGKDKLDNEEVAIDGARGGRHRWKLLAFKDNKAKDWRSPDKLWSTIGDICIDLIEDNSVISYVIS